MLPNGVVPAPLQRSAPVWPSGHTASSWFLARGAAVFPWRACIHLFQARWLRNQKNPRPLFSFLRQDGASPPKCVCWRECEAYSSVSSVPGWGSASARDSSLGVWIVASCCSSSLLRLWGALSEESQVCNACVAHELCSACELLELSGLIALGPGRPAGCGERSWRVLGVSRVMRGARGDGAPS